MTEQPTQDATGPLVRGSPWRIVFPILVSAALVTLAVSRVSIERLTETAGTLDWPPLLALTAAFVLALYFYDAACLRWLFSQPNLSLSYCTALHARGCSYLFSALNYGLGQAMLSWYMSRAVKIPLINALGRLALLLCHDMVVLLIMGLTASLFTSSEKVIAARTIFLIILGVLIVLMISAWFLPQRLRQRLRESKWGNWLSWWSVGRSLRLYVLRTLYFSIIMVYVAVGLPLCRVDVETRVLLSTVPLVVLVEGLPISMSGLGTRETTLTLLLDLSDPTPVVAFSLLWSTGLIVGRTLLGLGHWWLPRLWWLRKAP